MLYLVATPIGNLSDISHRAIEILQGVDYILCEDTRHSLKLLGRYGIHKPLKSYHKFNEAGRVESVLDDLRQERQIALISDAGSPAISDPGERLVFACIAAGLPLTAVPGPCAMIAALSLSGLPTDRFQFLGFLPRPKQQQQRIVAELLRYQGVSICYESPSRLVRLLEALALADPQRTLAVARELTKKFEEVRRGTASELLVYWQQKEPRGEFVVLIGPPGDDSMQEGHDLSLADHVAKLESEFGMSRSEAIKAVATERGVAKRAVYRAVHMPFA